MERCKGKLSLKLYSQISRWFASSASFTLLPLSRPHAMNPLGQVTHNVELRSGHLSAGAPELILSIVRDFLSLKQPFFLEKIAGQRGSRGLLRFTDNRLTVMCRNILTDAAVKEAIAWRNPSCHTLCSAQSSTHELLYFTRNTHRYTAPHK